MNPISVLRRPVTTEKSLASHGEGGAKRYTFEVDRRATKFQIKHVIEQQFGVHVLKINTSVRKGKTRRQTRSRGRIAIAPVKFAMITIKSGERIDALEVSAKGGSASGGKE